MSKKEKESIRKQGFNLEEIIVNTKTESGPVTKILKDRAQEAHAEYEETKIRRLVEEERQALKKLQSQGGTVGVGQAQNYVQMLFAGRNPEEIKEILESIEPEDIQKLAMMTSAMSNNQLGMLMSVMGKRDRSINDTVQLIKTIVEMNKPQASSTKDIIDAFKVGIEVAKSKTPPTPKESPLELAMKYIKPIYDTMSQKDRDLYQVQLDNIRNQIVDPIAYLQKIKEVAPSLGMVPASQSGKPNIELEKMKLDQEKWKIERDWDMMKWQQEMKLKQQSDRDKMKMIEKIAVPAIKKIGPVLDAAVNAGKQKISTMGVPRGSLPAKQAATAFLCPKCAEKGVQTIIDVGDMPDIAVCPTCKTEFPKAEG